MSDRVTILQAPHIAGIPAQELAMLVGITVPVVPRDYSYSFFVGGENEENREWKGFLSVDENVSLQICYTINDSDALGRVHLISCNDLFHFCPWQAPTLKQWFRVRERGQLFAISRDKCSAYL